MIGEEYTNEISSDIEYDVDVEKVIAPKSGSELTDFKVNENETDVSGCVFELR